MSLRPEPLPPIPDATAAAVCVFHAKAATDSTAKLPLIPREGCHPFHGKAATDSMPSLPPIPRQSCR
jgi:hypothetical protein